MIEEPNGLVTRFYDYMASGSFEELQGLYESDAALVRFDGSSEGLSEISAFFASVRAQHRPYKLRSIDQLIAVDDVLMWDALVDTDHGVLQTTDVWVLSPGGKVLRHIPGIRGYWGL